MMILLKPGLEIFMEDPLRKSPFLIFYSADRKDKTIMIVSVGRNSQNPANYP